MQSEQIILPVGNTVRSPNGDHYIIEELLGKGGFGAVYLVKDRHDEHKLFALKEVIDPSETDRARFTSEAELLMRLDHKALPHVYDVFENEKLKRVYMLMDYVKGRDLEVLLTEQPEQHFSLPLVLAIMGPIVDALTYMHNQDPPVIHRDIKPANIIVPLNAEEAVLVDFGLAKEYVSTKTTSVIRHGSPGYAALEQYGHGGTTPRTDIYGLGATLYTLLTGVVPPDPVTRITESRDVDTLTPVSLVNHAIPTAVASAIQQAMSLSAEDRFNTVAELWQEVTAHASDLKVKEDGFIATTAKPGVTTLRLPKPLTVTEQELTPVTTAILQPRRDVPLVRKRGILVSLALVIFLIGIVGASFLFSLLRHDNTVARTSQTRVASALKPSTSSPTSTSSLYPVLAISYNGSVGDVVAKRNTAMSLSHIVQNQESMHGLFKGLGLAGPFNGTVTTAGHVQFTVVILGGDSTLAFTGDIKIGGDMVGSYQVLNRQGQHTGQYGVWSTAPAA